MEHGRTIAKKRPVGLLAFILFLVIFPFLFPSHYFVGLMILIGIYSIITLGLSLLMGYAGQISLGHAAFFGIGAYFSGILTTSYDWSPWLAMIVGMFVTGLIAYLVGIPTLKLKEHFLVLATLGFNVIVYIILLGLQPITGGAAGMTGIPDLSLFGWSFQNDFAYYFFVWLLVLLLALFSLNIVESHIGRILRAIHDSEIAALTLGIDVAKYKVAIFVLSAVFASLAGSLYAHFMNFLAPPVFYITASIQFLVMMVVGGLKPIWGAIFGAFVMTVLGEIVRAVVPLFTDAGGEAEVVVYGAILIVFLMFLPKGLFALLQGWGTRFLRRERS